MTRLELDNFKLQIKSRNHRIPLWIGVASGLFLGVLSYSPIRSHFVVSKVHSKAYQIAKAEVNNNLTDPFSAQFKNEVVYKSSSISWALCGEVNAKNQFGGYTGYTKFVSSFFVDHVKKDVTKDVTFDTEQMHDIYLKDYTDNFYNE